MQNCIRFLVMIFIFAGSVVQAEMVTVDSFASLSGDIGEIDLQFVPTMNSHNRLKYSAYLLRILYGQGTQNDRAVDLMREFNSLKQQVNVADHQGENLDSGLENGIQSFFNLCLSEYSSTLGSQQTKLSDLVFKIEDANRKQD